MSALPPRTDIPGGVKYRGSNGLNDAIIVKGLDRYGKLYVDKNLFNTWLTVQNQNGQYRLPEQEKA